MTSTAWRNRQPMTAAPTPSPPSRATMPSSLRGRRFDNAGGKYRSMVAKQDPNSLFCMSNRTTASYQGIGRTNGLNDRSAIGWRHGRCLPSAMRVETDRPAWGPGAPVGATLPNRDQVSYSACHIGPPVSYRSHGPGFVQHRLLSQLTPKSQRGNGCLGFRV
jgi:hypothetical protein